MGIQAGRLTSFVNDLLDRIQQALDIVGEGVCVSIIRSVFARSAEGEHRAAALRTKDADQFAFIFIGNRMPQNEEIELSIPATFGCISKAERRTDCVTLAAKKQLAGAKQRFVVRHGKNMRSQWSLPNSLGRGALCFPSGFAIAKRYVGQFEVTIIEHRVRSLQGNFWSASLMLTQQIIVNP